MGPRMTNEEDLLARLAHYYSQSLNLVMEYAGPGVYFHTQCIKEQKRHFLSDRHVELIYATLPAWGMHRPGTHTTMHEFGVFKKSILQSSDALRRTSGKRFDALEAEELRSLLEHLKDVYCELRVSTSGTTVVSNAKALAHILPDLIPPIDRRHTIRFFRAVVPPALDKQFSLFVEMCFRLKQMYDKCDPRLFEIDPDTLIMAYVKSIPKP